MLEIGHAPAFAAGALDPVAARIVDDRETFVDEPVAELVPRPGEPLRKRRVGAQPDGQRRPGDPLRPTQAGKGHPLRHAGDDRPIDFARAFLHTATMKDCARS